MILPFGYSSTRSKAVPKIDFSHWKVDGRSSYLQKNSMHDLRGGQKYTVMPSYVPR